MILERTKEKARRVVYRAVKSGQLIRPEKCSRCPWIGKPQAHHEDYACPLDVVWVCPKCHQKESAKTHKANRTPRFQRWFSQPRPYMSTIEKARILQDNLIPKEA